MIKTKSRIISVLFDNSVRKNQKRIKIRAEYQESPVAIHQ